MYSPYVFASFSPDGFETPIKTVREDCSHDNVSKKTSEFGLGLVDDVLGSMTQVESKSPHEQALCIKNYPRCTFTYPLFRLKKMYLGS